MISNPEIQLKYDSLGDFTWYLSEYWKLYYKFELERFWNKIDIGDSSYAKRIGDVFSRRRKVAARSNEMRIFRSSAANKFDLNLLSVRAILYGFESTSDNCKCWPIFYKGGVPTVVSLLIISYYQRHINFLFPNPSNFELLPSSLNLQLKSGPWNTIASKFTRSFINSHFLPLNFDIKFDNATNGS